MEVGDLLEGLRLRRKLLGLCVAGSFVGRVCQVCVGFWIIRPENLKANIFRGLPFRTSAKTSDTVPGIDSSTAKKSIFG